MIDLHGLHVSEAIRTLKHELSVLKSTARAADRSNNILKVTKQAQRLLKSPNAPFYRTETNESCKVLVQISRHNLAIFW